MWDCQRANIILEIICVLLSYRTWKNEIKRKMDRLQS